MTNSTNVERGRLRARRSLLALSTVLCSGLAAPALAQTSPAPLRLTLDKNGVDLTNGTFNYKQTDVSIGPDNPDGLAFTRTYGPSPADSEYTGFVSVDTSGTPTIVNITVGATSHSFSQSGSSYVSLQGDGSTLVFSSGLWIYKSSLGVEYTLFRTLTDHGDWLTGIQKIKYPTGQVISITYTVANQMITPCTTRPCSYITRQRISSVNNSSGFQLKYSYASNSLALNGGAGWLVLTQVQAINNKVDYCDPAALTCAGFTVSWPTATYSRTTGSPVVTTVVNDRGESWRFTESGLAGYGIKRPSASSDTTSVAFGSGGLVSSVIADGITTNYAFVDSGGTRTVTVTTPDSAQTVVKSNISTGLVSSIKDALLQETTYAYDTSGRLTEIVRPEGDKTDYSYDARGNTILTTLKAKPSAPAPDIVTSASFPSTCSNQLTCNRPDWTKDGNGSQTDYTYDGTTGLVTTITSPAPTVGAVRPQTRFGYSALQANYKNSSGTVTASGIAVTKLTTVSKCQTMVSCVGTADEVKITFAYDSNLLPSSRTDSAGDGSVSTTTTATYTNLGDIATIDGPLPGSDDTTTVRYGPGRREAGIINPDPDGSGPLKRRALKTSYNSDGQPTVVGLGTVNGTTDSDWAAFATAQQSTASYDANARKSVDTVTAGGTTYGVTQYSYDTVGRLECTAVRMNASAWGSLPSSACTLQTTGSAGPDRITKASYDAAGRQTKVQTAYGTSDQADEASASYSDNGKVQSVTDAEGNKTSYAYDGFDRLAKTNYPSTTKGAGTSSTTDYEQLGYDANGNVTSRRLRDGTSIGYSYDALNRLTAKDLPGSELDVAYTYDLVDEPLSAATSAQTLTFTWDALGRNLTQAGPQGTATSAWDASGRRTQLTWPGGTFYVTYDYDTVGETTAIKESGTTSLATFGYDDLGRRTSLTLGNGVVTSYGYDGASRLTSLGLDLAGTGDDLSLTFGYTPASQIASTTRSNDAYAWTGAATATKGYTSNGLNQYSAAAGSTLGFDARGNTTAIGGSSYTYSSENLLLSGPNSASLTYDPLLRLYQTSASGFTTTRFAYDGDALIAEYDTSGTLLRRYVHGPGTNEPLVEYDGSGNKTWLAADERGSVLSRSNSSGASTAKNSYDEYGAPGSSNAGRFGYTGQAWLAEIGVAYYVARMYAPSLGWFLQTDPIGYGYGLNWYNYTGSDPVNATDPSGTVEIVITGTRRACDDGWTCYSGDSFWFLSSSTFSAPTGGGGDGGGDGEIVITGTRHQTTPKPKSQAARQSQQPLCLAMCLMGRVIALLPRPKPDDTPKIEIDGKCMDRGARNFGNASIFDKFGLWSAPTAKIARGLSHSIAGFNAAALTGAVATEPLYLLSASIAQSCQTRR